MKKLHARSALATLAVALIGFSTPAAAAPVYCSAVSTTRNYMAIDDGQAAACLLSGANNIGQASFNDPFLTSSAGAGWTNVSGDAGLSFTQDGSTGGWSFDSSLWDKYANLAIGFKFGTGKKADGWFTYSLANGVSAGDWQLFNVFGRGGGLSHLVLYANGENSVPEPGTLGLLGFGLAGLAAAARRRRRKA
jgi:hypothetical protein